MKKFLPVLLLMVFIMSACQPTATPTVESTSTPSATAAPTETPRATPTSPFAARTTQPINDQATTIPERVSSIDGMIQAYVPAGSFRMGGLDPHAANDEKPDHIVTLHAFWMDKLEVTNGMYALCVRAGVCQLPVELKSETRDSYFGNAAFNDYPVVYVTWDDANTYCRWAGRRLPTEAEWERAARGDDYRTWPWGDEPPDPTLANFNYLIGDTSRVGSYPEGASPFGIFDMAGNVAEWVSDLYDAEYYLDNVSSNPTGPEARIGKYYRVARGGSYQDAEINIRVAKRSSVLGPNPNAKPNTTALTGDVSPKIGFRCASDE